MCFQTVCSGVKGYYISSAMASLTSSSRRSSSSYRSSSRYSTSSSYRSEGSLGGSSDCLDHLFEPFLDSADHSSLFGEEGPGGPTCLVPFSRQTRSTYGHTGKGLTVHEAPSPLVTAAVPQAVFNDNRHKFTAHN